MASKTIILKGTPKQETCKIGEASMYPGALVEELTARTVTMHATEAGNAEKMFLIEDALQGKEISDVFTNAAQCQVAHCKSGDEIYAWLADGENASVGEALVSAGSGGDLQCFSASQDFGSDNTGNIYPDAIVAYALEAVDLDGSSNTAHSRIKVRVA